MDGCAEAESATADLVEHLGVTSSPAASATDAARSSPILILWMALVIACNGVLWLTGARSSALGEAVERGAARAESRGIGEVSDDLVRKAVQTQHDTLAFWTTLALLGDFIAEPLALAVRAVAAATCFSALAALVGRPVRHELALAECSAAQGIWVLGMAIRTVLVVVLRRPDVETSAALFLTPGPHTAHALLTLRQVDLFPLLGWAVIARGARRRGQTRLGAAIAVCLSLALVEADIRIIAGLVTGSAMRLELIPDWL